MKKISMSAITVSGIGSFLLYAAPAQAWDWVVEAHVAVAEASYAPNVVVFQIDAPAGSCPVGSWINYYPPQSSDPLKMSAYNAVYSLVLTAISTQRPVVIYGNNSGCTVSNVWIRR